MVALWQLSPGYTPCIAGIQQEVPMIACVFDVETTYGKHLKRVGSPFAPGVIDLCASGFLFDDGQYNDHYLVAPDDEGVRHGVPRGSAEWLVSFPSLAGVDVLVGHNIKFDLLWYWRHPELEAFLKRGGVVWDTAYAEYLLSGTLYNLKQPEHLRPSLAVCAARRDLTRKLDVVKAMWDQKIRTEDVPEAVLMEYLQGDCQTTLELYNEQIAQAERQRQTHMIKGRMEGLLATTEMEFNGLMIDLSEAQTQQADLEQEIEQLKKQLQEFVPAGLPPALEFNWGSTAHLSALLFGGSIKYTDREFVLDSFGNKTYFQKDATQIVYEADGKTPVVFKGGKNAGMIKTKKVKVPDIDRGPKMRNADFWHTLPRTTEPKDKWKSATDGQWSTAREVMEELQTRNIPLVRHLLRLRGAEKDLGTYYQRFYKGELTGMLTLVNADSTVHASLEHLVTGTTRLSCREPNLQNLSKKGKSKVRKCFKSRFGDDGIVAEGDYSQLEVVCKGVLSGDENLLAALKNNIDFHCEWLAMAPIGEGKSYAEVHRLCKADHDPIWEAKRSSIKPLTFG
jgi:hypothetical protein